MVTIEEIGITFAWIFIASFFSVAGLICYCSCCLPLVRLILHKLNLLKFNIDFKPEFPEKVRQLDLGESEYFDFREETKLFELGDKIRVASYNIEDGKQISGVIEDIKLINPDILLLQEVDVFSKKVGLNTGKEIAWALKLNYFNTCTKHSGDGYQGNAILTRFDVFEERRVKYICGIYKNWYKKNHGFHSSPAPILEIIKDTLYIQPISVHLDAIYSGRSQRVKQMNSLLEHAEREYSRNNTEVKKNVIQIVGGDLNTISTGIGRFCYLVSPDCDSSFGNFGISEAEELENKVIRNSRFFDPFKKYSWCSLVPRYSVDATMKVYGVFAAKVDWLLFPKKEVVVVKRGILQGSSDHMMIFSDIQIEGF